MGDYPVDGGQLALYFTFTFLSIIASLVLYFFYQHCQGFVDKDHQEYIRIFAEISAIGSVSKIMSEDDRPLEQLLD